MHYYILIYTSSVNDMISINIPYVYNLSFPFIASTNPFASPSATNAVDPFGMSEFNPSTPNASNPSAIKSTEQELMDIQVHAPIITVS